MLPTTPAEIYGVIEDAATISNRTGDDSHTGDNVLAGGDVDELRPGDGVDDLLSEGVPRDVPGEGGGPRKAMGEATNTGAASAISNRTQGGPCQAMDEAKILDYAMNIVPSKAMLTKLTGNKQGIINSENFHQWVKNAGSTVTKLHSQAYLLQRAVSALEQDHENKARAVTDDDDASTNGGDDDRTTFQYNIHDIINPKKKTKTKKKNSKKKW